MSERQRPQQMPSPNRQAVEAQINQKYKRLTRLQRGTGLLCLLLGMFSGYADSKAVAKGDEDIPATFLTVPIAATLSMYSVHTGRRTRRGAEGLINNYAEQMGAADSVEARFTRTKMYAEPDRIVIESSGDITALGGELYDQTHGSILRLSNAVRDGGAYLGGFALNGFTGDFLLHSPAAPPQAIGLIGVASVGVGALVQMIEDGSAGAHLRGYSIQLDNIDASFGRGPDLPPPPES